MLIKTYYFFFSDQGHPPSDSPNDSSDYGNESEDDSDNYFEILESITKKWLLIQLTHNVSAAATNSFWQASFDSIPILCAVKERCNIDVNVPGFIHIRRKLYSNICPTVHMKYVFLERSTNSIEVVHCTKDPGKRYLKSRYTKLYEEAHIKVNYKCKLIMLLKQMLLKTDLFCS